MDSATGWRRAALAAVILAAGAHGEAAPLAAPGQIGKPPAGATAACAFEALTNDPDPAGLNVRRDPSPTAPILGRLPPIQSRDPAIGTVLPTFRVIGVRDGWFLIEDARYDPGYQVPPSSPRLFSGRGWVAGNRITTGLRAMTLKAAPRDDAPDVVALSGDDGGAAFGPSEVSVRRILDCSGAWFLVEVPLNANGVRLKPLRPSGGPADTVRGWTKGYCTEQLTTCV